MLQFINQHVDRLSKMRPVWPKQFSNKRISHPYKLLLRSKKLLNFKINSAQAKLIKFFSMRPQRLIL